MGTFAFIVLTLTNEDNTGNATNVVAAKVLFFKNVRLLSMVVAPLFILKPRLKLARFVLLNYFLIKCVDAGSTIHSEIVEWCNTNLKNLEPVDTGKGIHFLQEDNPHLIGEELAKLYQMIPGQSG